ncbi:uncharacterized protein BXZ73DRAFT_102061 [Epithele typhae]|uniref:uncharacterized protein n=1 Tax=Epithele typhae TaxID=378194 RepID=UPI0020077F13|nr:uncharacterized protein BXZ73DRAFT_102061 [Epithele typhae]KAH9929531.1 hypothetical protein BXZ73DRAFT_102061 [Epithele typhae]
MAAALSSPEPQPVDLDDLDSDSDDSEMESSVAMLIQKSKQKRKADLASAPSSPESETSFGPRYNLRRSSPSIPRKAPSAPTQARTVKKIDPFAILLREKRRDERTGMGMTIIREADRTVAEHKASLLSDMDDGDWIEGDTRGDDSDDEMDNTEAIANANRWLGPSAKAVDAILASDSREKKERNMEKLRESIGVPFWLQGQAVDEVMGRDPGSSIPPFTDSDDHPLFRRLRDITARQDHIQMEVLLSSSFSFLKPCQRTPVISWLFEVAFSDMPSPLPDLAFSRLVELAPTNGIPVLHEVSITRALLRIGASPAALSQHGLALSITPMTPQTYTLRKRSQFRYNVYRLTFYSTWDPTKRSDTMLMMLLLTLDSTTSDQALVEVKRANDSLAKALSAAEELILCKKLVPFGQKLSPANQALLLSSIPSVSDSAIRIARVVARALLLGTSDLSADDLDHLPSLRPLIGLLSAPSGSKEAFDVTGNADAPGFFNDLSCRVELLSRALTNIHDYAIQELRSVSSSASQDLNKSTDGDASKESVFRERDRQKTTPLQHITARLNTLHGNIVDTRAAHLDRSRAKAALQRLSFRVHYQRMAALALRSAGAQRNLLGYFQSSS